MTDEGFKIDHVRSQRTARKAAQAGVDEAPLARFLAAGILKAPFYGA